MQDAISHHKVPALVQQYYTNTRSKSIARQFYEWCDKQEKERFLWTGISLMGYIGTLIPLALLAVVFSGNNFMLWIIISATAPVILTVNLAALPTKVILPVLFSVVFINLMVILYCISLLLAGVN